MRVGYLGPRATFTHLAVDTFFGESADALAYATIPHCMDAAASGEIEAAVVPLENALEGSVNLTVDYLVHERPLTIVGEIVFPIRQHLMVHPEHVDSWSKVDCILSHSHAIAQCHKFLHSHFKNARFEYAASTGAAAQYISQHPQEKSAVIANDLAAAEYGLSIVKQDIHDYHYNHTRFAVLAPGEIELPRQPLQGTPKTTLMVMLPSDQSGALHQVLSAFSWRKLNLSKIESRPMKTGLGNYFFMIDVEMELDEVLIPGAISEIQALGCEVKVLGSYHAYILK
ncbi:prephenate dehydratase [Bacillus lacus]|uniref:Prephenate dehydratase n=1 Tax=Metabacillus lacus TaxID=1983721 RepID=A0A7X2IXH1_9BACI|nr:prephenate dehydratase [Metabacillus lacus]MRX71409.1 prephenate dehydratase [Metabacillus lacus]